MDKPTIIRILSNFRYLFKDMSFGENIIFQKISAYLPSNYMVFPCDIIDIREILLTEKLRFVDYVPLFSQKFAEEFLKRYALFLVIDIRKIDIDSFKYGGLCIIRDKEIGIGQSLTRIIVNEPVVKNGFEVVTNIMDQIGKRVECIVSNSIPGLSSPTPKLSVVVDRSFKVSQNINSEIPLTPKEDNVFKFLRQVKKDYNLKVQMRVAGGWVRDKLLGKDSDDIDIAVNMPGYELAQIIADAAVKYNVTHDPKAYRVSLEKSADPNEKEPSDNLMVGAVYLFGQKIEFVPMRTEHYPDPDSRQPQITTTNDPKEDVVRRDLTINALYYNVDTGKVEDFVGGKKDLGVEGGPIVLRTPDDPIKTFEEDPLRLLRVLRFHSRYPNSKIDDGIMQAMSNPTIQQSYLRKVATERAGPEIMKMMVGEDPASALRILFESGLYKAVFKVPSMESLNPDGITMDQKTPYHKFNLLDHTLEVVKNLNNIMKQNNESDEMRGLMNLAGMLHDFGKMRKGVQRKHPRNKGQMQYIGHEKASEKMADDIMKSIGIGKDKRDIVKQVVKLHMRPLNANEWGPKGRGKFLRDTRLHGREEEHNDLWKYIFYHAQADQMSSQPDKFNEEEHQRVFDNFRQYVESPVGSFRGTVLNGNDIIALFPQLKPDTGYIKDVLDKIKVWQDTGKIDVSADQEIARSQAIQLVKNIAPQIINKYKEPTMGNNWYNKIRVSQSVEDGSSFEQEDPEVVKGPEPVKPKYQRGMKVRDRRRGVANPQEFGIVEGIKDNIVRIIWNPDDKDKKRQEDFDMVEDTEKLSLIVAEI